MIDFEHVYKTYETHNDENVALEDINIHIDEGEFVFILGHSGAGKSTFLKLIQMEEKPTEGKVFINGQDLTRIKRRKVPYLRRQMGVVFQDFRLIPTMTVYENVAFAMRVTNISTKKIKDRVPFALSLVGLEDKMDRLPDELSGGEQQRVAVARALAHGPKLIIADEPVSALDVTVQSQILRLILRLHDEKKMTILFITHDLNIVRRICRRVVVLYRGEIVESGLAEEIYRAPAHPYTELLLNSAPDGDTAASEKAVADIGEGVPAGFRGCFFYPRCPKRCSRCREARPEDTMVAAGHTARCFRLM